MRAIYAFLDCGIPENVWPVFSATGAAVTISWPSPAACGWPARVVPRSARSCSARRSVDWSGPFLISGRLRTGPDLSGLNPPPNTPRPGNVRPKTRGPAPTCSGIPAKPFNTTRKGPSRWMDHPLTKPRDALTRPFPASSIVHAFLIFLWKGSRGSSGGLSRGDRARPPSLRPFRMPRELPSARGPSSLSGGVVLLSSSLFS